MKQNKTMIINDLLNPSGFSVIAGPCTIESRESLAEIAAALKEIGINILRGGVYKMRTSVHSFRGLGDIALAYLKEVGERYGMVTVSECIDVTKVELMSDYIDVFLIGMRNMQNYPLLEAIGKTNKPVILKRGMSSTYKEWLLAAEYLAETGNHNIVLCERGIRTFEPHTRNTLDLSSVPVLKSKSKYPVIVDPSHSTGHRDYVKSMSWAATAAGANGLLIETHLNPETSLCDAEQAVTIDELKAIVKPIDELRRALSL